MRDMLQAKADFSSPDTATRQGSDVCLPGALFQTLGSEQFECLRDFDCGSLTVIEFVEIDGSEINGVGMIE